MSGGSGNDNLLNMGLMIAAGIAAPALAPMLMTGGAAGLGLGATAATAATGATLGGLAGAVTGKDPLQSAVMGGLGGAASGYFGGVNPAEAGSMLAATPSVPVGADPTSLLSAGSSVPNTATTFTSPLPDVANVSKSAAQLPVQQQLFGFPKAQTIGGGIAGINEILSAQPTSAYIPPDSKYKGGSLANFKYDPNRYTPADVPPLPYSYREMAMGGLAMGGIPPQTNFANPSQSMMGTSQYDMPTDPFSGNIANRMAGGGLASLGMYSDGGRLLRGPGDGVSDNIPARIGQRQEARLADGEFVVPARIVSELGNGSTEAGAKRLYKMMDNVQNSRKKSIGKGKFAQNTKAYKHLPA